MTNKEIEIMNYIKDNYSNLEPTIPIVIPSYKNREGTIIRHLEDLGNSEIYIFVYEDDYTKSGYNEYDNKSNVHFIKINSKWRSIQRKRYYIQSYFMNKPDIHDYIMIDDDILDGKIWLIDGQRLVHQPIKNLLGAMCYAYLQQDNRTYAGPNNCEIGWGHWNSMSTKKFTTNQPFYQIFFVNNDYIRNGGVKFRDLESFGEDCILYFDINESNQQVIQFPWIKFAFYKDNSVKYSIASNELESAKVVINTIRIFGNKASLRHSTKSKKYELFTKYKKGKTINPYWNEIEPILLDESKSYVERRNEILNIVDKYNKDK